MNIDHYEIQYWNGCKQQRTGMNVNNKEKIAKSLIFIKIKTYERERERERERNSWQWKIT